MLKAIVLSVLIVSVISGSSRQADLSDVTQHADAGVHDLKYDQEAFLGKEEAEEYSKLTPEESKNRLRILVEKKIDKSEDGQVDKTELKDWINYISKKWLINERDSAWEYYNQQNKPLLDFESYYEVNYGNNIENQYTGNELKRALKDVELDKIKWQLADTNSDGLLSIDEFFAFVRPEEVPAMKGFLIDDILSKSDKNSDGYIDKDEYADEIYTRDPQLQRGRDPEPAWIASELSLFSDNLDRNNDGKMDRVEISEWVKPDGFDGAEAETQHLIGHADTNKDGQLSVDEIVAHNDLFAGSQATNYGSILHEKEEL